MNRLARSTLGSLWLLAAACASNGSGGGGSGGDRGPVGGGGSAAAAGGAGPMSGSGGSLGGAGGSDAGASGNASSGGEDASGGAGRGGANVDARVSGMGGFDGGPSVPVVGDGGRESGLADRAVSEVGAADGSRIEAGAEAAPPAPCSPPIPVTTGTAATVTVNLPMTRAVVGPDLMGLHIAVYDGRIGTPAVVDLLRNAGVTSLRYPGGSYADLYHWESHTGVTTSPAMGAGSTVITITPGTDFGSFASILQRVNANAFITLNYGSNSAGTGPGDPHEAAAWVAYANSMPDNTTVIGVDASGKNWGTAGDWARLRSSSPLATNDGMNMLRIAHPAPIGVKYWELGNELYGNGFYGVGGACGWEVDLHAPYTTAACTGRIGNPALSPATYGAAVREFSAAIKRIDPTVQFGAIVLWPVVNNSYPNWNSTVLGLACTPTPAIDFVVNHWYPGTTVASLLTIPGTDIPAMYRDLHANVASLCGAAAVTMPIAVTEWGPDTLYGGAAIGAAFNPPAPATPSQTQVGGIYAAESYANFMEQGALAVHFQQLHPGASGATYLDANDGASWGYHGQLIAHHLGGVGDTMVQATSSLPTLLTHAALRPDGGINVMLTNTSPSAAANATVNVAGGSGSLACAGSRYAYTPVNGNIDGPVTGPQPIFASATGSSVSVAVPAYSVVVVSFPKR